MKKRYITWRTRDGRKIPITEMTDEHLVNTIAYLKRRVASREYKAPPEIHTCPIWSIDDGPCFGCDSDAIMKSQLESWIEIFETEKVRRANVEHV